MTEDFNLHVLQVALDNDPARKEMGLVRATILMLSLGIAAVVAWQVLATDWAFERMTRQVQTIQDDALAFAMAQGVTKEVPAQENGSAEAMLSAKAVFVPARHIPELRGFVCQREPSGAVFIHEYRAGARLHPEERIRAQGGAAGAFCDKALASVE